MKQTKRFFILGLILTLIPFIYSCNSGGDSLDVSTKLDPPTDLMATSIDSLTISIMWNDAATFIRDNLKYYEIKVKEIGGNESEEVILTTKSSNKPYIIKGFEPNKVYSFEVKTVYENGQTSDPLIIQWATAKRFEKFNQEPFRLYEPGSWEGGGLQLFDGDRARRISTTEIEDWSLGLYATSISSSILFGSANKMPYSNSVKATNAYMISDKVIYANSLSDFHMSTDMSESSANINYDYRLLDLDTINPGDKSGIIINVALDKGKNKNPSEMQYGKVFVKYNKNDDSFFYEYEDERFIVVAVSYQTKVGLPYAKK